MPRDEALFLVKDKEILNRIHHSINDAVTEA